MAIGVLILGESGTGKTTSLRNMRDCCYINVSGKPLPLRDGPDEVLESSDAAVIINKMKTTHKKAIVIDDAQYIMAFSYMHRIKEQGWEKYNEMQSDFFRVIDAIPKLPKDTVVYILSHIQTLDDGRQKIKTIGKMLDEKVTIEGMFSIVLKTMVSDERYCFCTQNSGMDTTKSPMGMFDSYLIDNDLQLVDNKVRNYYHFEGAISDTEVAEQEKAATVEAEKPQRRRRKKEDAEPEKKQRSRSADPEPEAKAEDDAPAPAPKRKRRSEKEKILMSGIEDAKNGEEEVPYE